MRDNKRGTIEDPSTDRVLALAFEQEKQERLLRSAELDNALNDLSVTPNGVRLENFSVRVDIIEDVRRELGDEAARILSDHVALEAAIGSTTDVEHRVRRLIERGHTGELHIARVMSERDLQNGSTASRFEEYAAVARRLLAAR